MREYRDKVPQYEEVKDSQDFNEKSILSVDFAGMPEERINADALYSDKQAFWSFHEKKILAGMACCMIYFLIIVM